MRNIWGVAIVTVAGIALIICAAIVSGAYKYKYQGQETIVVTGLGEEEFTSDHIVWRGWLTAHNSSAEAGYREIEESKRKVMAYLTTNGLPEDAVVFMFVNVYKDYEPVYGSNGYMGQRFSGYALRQGFTVESRTDLTVVENISREISSLIAQGVQIEAGEPEYYYSELDRMKLELIEKSTADARARAEKIASEAGAKLKNLKSARMGVFQITGANSNEEFSAGGNFNTSSKDKKARITMRLEYTVK